ncbi:MAG: hypothetical protein WCT17_03115, partial [Bacilli bacterium]
QLHEQSITIATWPTKVPSYEYRVLSDMKMIFDVITSVRNLRATKNITNKTAIDLILQVKDRKAMNFLKKNQAIIEKFCHTQKLTMTEESQDTVGCSLIVIDRITLLIPMKNILNLTDAIAKLTLEKQKMTQEVTRCEKMLQNASFIQKAPASKVTEEQLKLQQYQQRLQEIEQLLNEYTQL